MYLKSVTLLAKSHPMWVCGLKRPASCKPVARLAVAPYVGVWIETANATANYIQSLSHPMWVCGLKHRWYHRKGLYPGRTLCGCVD